MYGIFNKLTKENILRYVDSFTIFKRYCEGFEEIGKAFKSPLRAESKPSAFIIIFKDDLLFKDFGLGSFRAIDFVSVKYNLTFTEALQKINCDFNLRLGEYPNFDDFTAKKTIIPIEYKEKKPCIISIKRREYDVKDLDYWYGKYKIKINTLVKFGVVPISHFTLNDYLYFAAPLSYSYNYYWENDVYRRKIYQPLSSEKWFSNGGAIVQGEGMLPRNGDLLIITSSLKDVMTLYEFGHTAIAPTSETSFLPEQYFAKQENRFKKIVLFMDSDEAGMLANIRLSEKWKLPYIYIENKYGAKDISDFVNKYGYELTKKMLHEKNL